MYQYVQCGRYSTGYIVYVLVQKLMESASIYLRNSPVKLVDMVDECEDYISTLRNLAIEVYTYITQWSQSL